MTLLRAISAPFLALAICPILFVWAAAAVYAGAAQATTGTFANLTITGGTPTNGAVWVATNTSGQGTWSGPCAVYAQGGWPFTIAHAENVNVGYSNLVYNVGGAFDGTNWTPGALGWYEFNGSVCVNTIADDVGMLVTFALIKNASAYALITRDYSLGRTRSTVPCSCVIYNDHVTNSYKFNLYNASGRTLTNHPEASRNVFSGVLLRP